MVITRIKARSIFKVAVYGPQAGEPWKDAACRCFLKNSFSVKLKSP